MVYKKYLLTLLLFTSCSINTFDKKSLPELPIVPNCLNWTNKSDMQKLSMFIVGTGLITGVASAYMIASSLHLFVTYQNKDRRTFKKVAKVWAAVGGVMGGLLALWIGANLYEDFRTSNI